MEYRLCFQETEGSSQCQGTRSSCTGWGPTPSWTSHFRDDTDNRGGGCRYAWKIELRPAKAIHVCRVCFKETEGSSQCQGNRQSCSGWSAPMIRNPHWTLPFRDDTDNRGWGCAYRWYLDCTSLYEAIFCPRDSPCNWKKKYSVFTIFKSLLAEKREWFLFLTTYRQWDVKCNGQNFSQDV